MKDIKSILKEATQDLLSEEVLKEIENAFNASVQEKVQIHVTKALTEQDEDYSNKLENLLEAIDADHTKKLEKVVEAIDANHAEKLKAIVAKYSAALNEEAKNFKDATVNNISTYLEAYLDETVPAADIEAAVKNKRAIAVLEQVRSLLGVDAALAKDSVRDAVLDGKRQIDEASKKLEAASGEIEQLKKQLAARDAELTLEKTTSKLPAAKRNYVLKVMNGKSAQFITENVEYALGLFDKTEKERLQNIKEEATEEAVAATVDVPVVEESTEAPAQEQAFMSPYLKELSKY